VARAVRACTPEQQQVCALQQASPQLAHAPLTPTPHPCTPHTTPDPHRPSRMAPSRQARCLARGGGSGWTRSCATPTRSPLTRCVCLRVAVTRLIGREVRISVCISSRATRTPSWKHGKRLCVRPAPTALDACVHPHQACTHLSSRACVCVARHSLPHRQYIPGLVATLALVMINCIRR
jgi:hypothetical protein